MIQNVNARPVVFDLFYTFEIRNQKLHLLERPCLKKT